MLGLMGVCAVTEVSYAWLLWFIPLCVVAYLTSVGVAYRAFYSRQHNCWALDDIKFAAAFWPFTAPVFLGLWLATPRPKSSVPQAKVVRQ